MSETPKTDMRWDDLGADGADSSTIPLMLIAEMLERIAIALEED